MIIAFQNSSETLWLPFFSLNDKVYESPIYIFFAVVQLIIYICTAYIIVRTCSIFLRIRVFHENKNFLMAFFLLQWFEGILAKAVILPYQIGLIVIGNDTEKSYFSWWSVDKQDMIFIRNTQEILPLYVASYVFRHYMFSMFFGIMAIGCERALATYYIQDYECVPRRHIPLFLILFVNIATIPYVYFVIHNKIPFFVIYSHWALCIILLLVGYLVILRINIIFRNQLFKCADHRKYSLARKFQVEENIRSLTIARKSVIVIMIYIFLTLSVFTCLMMGVFEEYKTVFVHILENFIVLPAPVVSISLLCSSRAFKEEFLRKLPIFGSCRGGSRVDNYDFRQKQSIVSESEVYFEQLKNSWNS
ncbi:hypothetical protein GCK72_006690 [Caenorhabditis remanei]|uniref:Uncharacterized protein n=1 Tax=Caenorhabditis remanei TaxID=31234 RepID=A0A6A5HLI2_CAERE|nr:hypothetical protein GCK72_006690 [Caenorhabditis remanei]KAF1766732.1 hypothetical protein GCK72_006690 [Caenorhabditis remanei]